MRSTSTILRLLIAVALIILISGAYNIAVNNTASVVQIIALAGLGAVTVVALLGFIVRLFTTGR